MMAAKYRRMISIGGQEVPLVEAAERNGLGAKTVRNRIYRGWTPEQSLGLDPPPLPKTGAPTQNVIGFNEEQRERQVQVSGDDRFREAMKLAGYAMSVCTTPGTDKPQPMLRCVTGRQHNHVTFPQTW